MFSDISRVALNKDVNNVTTVLFLDDNADMHYPSDLKSLGDLLDVGHTSGAVIGKLV